MKASYNEGYEPTSLALEDNKKMEDLLQLKRKKKNRSKMYMLIGLVCLVFINVVDEVVTSMSGTVQSSVINEFFVKGRGLTYNEGIAEYAKILTLGSMLGFLSPFYKTLSDRFGRKIFIIFNVIVMAIGMLLSFWSPTFMVFAFGLLSIEFIKGHDMQIVYVQEVAPPKYRARMYSSIKALGVLGLALVPMLRNVFMGEDSTRWRAIFLIPGLIALLIAVVSYFFLDETDTFIDSQVEKITAKSNNQEVEKSSVLNGFKYIFSNRQLTWTILAFFLYYLSITAMSGYYQSIMYQGGMDVEQVTQALFMYPIVYFILTFFSGYIADFLGRKKLIIMSITGAIASFMLFNYGVGAGWNPYVVGSLYGLYIGNYWIGGDYLMMMSGEKAPTRLRATVMGNLSFVLKLASVSGNIIVTQLLGTMSVGAACLSVAIPSTLIAGVIIVLNLKETKGIDLSKIGMSE